MTPADIGAYGEEFYQQVLPLHGPDPDGLAHDLVGAWSHGVREVDELVRDTPEGPGWSVILDVNDAPIKGLAWLAQLAGVELRQPRVMQMTNLITHPDFEVGLWWGEIGGTFSVVAGGTSPGGAAMGNFVSLANGVDIGMPYTEAIPVIAGKEYTASIDVISTSSPVFLRIEWLNLGTPISHADSDPLGGDGRLSVSSIAPGSSDELTITVYFVSTLIGESFNVDSLALRRSDEPDAGTYFDGNSPGGAWAGVVSESESTLGRLETDEEWAIYARDAILRQGGRNRGTPDAILSAAEDTLTGSKQARLLERVGGNAYRYTLITRPSETPDPALTEARANTQVPAGSKLTHALTEGAAIDEGSKSIDSVTADIDSATLPDIAD